MPDHVPVPFTAIKLLMEYDASNMKRKVMDDASMMIIPISPSKLGWLSCEYTSAGVHYV